MTRFHSHHFARFLGARGGTFFERDALLAREMPGGKLMLIDGHLRQDTTPRMKVPVLVLNLTEAEADKLLLTLDPLASMAETDAERVRALLSTVQTDSQAIGALLERVAGQEGWQAVNQPGELVDPPAQVDRAGEQGQMGHGARPGLDNWAASAGLR